MIIGLSGFLRKGNDYLYMAAHRKDILETREPIVICEIGCNHMGDMDVALDMINTAAQFCKVDVVKFQKRNIPEVLDEEERDAPHSNPAYSFGKTYGKHREYLEFTLKQHRILKEECEKRNVRYSSSVWDLTSAREIVSLNPALIKIPSACNTHFKMLEYLCDDYEGEIHVSLGMTTHKEEDSIVDFFIKHNRNKNIVLYACTSGYPILDEDVCLYEIKRLHDKFGKIVKAIGFSGHHKGIAIDIAAFLLGAKYIERHFTLDRTWKGSDHAASLEPDGLRRLVRDLQCVSVALRYKPKEILDIEEEQRKKLKWNRKQLYGSTSKYAK